MGNLILLTDLLSLSLLTAGTTGHRHTVQGILWQTSNLVKNPRLLPQSLSVHASCTIYLFITNAVILGTSHCFPSPNFLLGKLQFVSQFLSSTGLFKGKHVTEIKAVLKMVLSRVTRGTIVIVGYQPDFIWSGVNYSRDMVRHHPRQLVPFLTSRGSCSLPTPPLCNARQCFRYHCFLWFDSRIFSSIFS